MKNIKIFKTIKAYVCMGQFVNGELKVYMEMKMLGLIA